MTAARMSFILALCSLALPACALLEPGGPVAAINVRAHTSAQVSEVVERVFIDHGYQPILRDIDGITFERNGSKADQIVYGDWDNGQRVSRRVKVSIASRDDVHYRLRCIPYVTRAPHDDAFEDQHRSPEIFSVEFTRYLREAREQCEELWRERGDS